MPAMWRCEGAARAAPRCRVVVARDGWSGKAMAGGCHLHRRIETVPERLYEDSASGRQDARRGLTACLKALQPGNPLVVWKLNRLGRTLTHLIHVVEALSQRHVGFKVLAGAGAQIDATTANGRLIFSIFAALAEFEAALIRERTHAGLAAARARGRLGGRPRKLTKATLRMAMAAMAGPQAQAR